MLRRRITRQGWFALWVCLLSLALGGPDALAQIKAKRAEITKTALSRSALPAGGEAMLAVVLEIEPGFHAQSHTPSEKQYVKFVLKMNEHPDLEFGEPTYPAGKDETYPALGTLNVYTGKVVVRVPVKAKAGAAAGTTQATGRLTYQICDDKVCYIPESLKFSADVKVVAAGAATEANEAELFKTEETPAPPEKKAEPGAASPTTAAAVASADIFATGLEGSNWSLRYALSAAFIAGLLFNVMPCVLPVLPLKASGFYEAAGHDRGKSFILGLVFSLGLISVFALLGLFILVFKAFTWGELFSRGWFVWSIVAILVALAFGLFGAYTFRLPVGAYTFEPKHDTFAGNFLLGALTAVLATPCTAPLLPPLLLWATSQPAYVGVPAFITVGIGMASPYLILSALPELARRFPRTGPWSELFKQMMGFMMLVAAAYFAAGRLVHGPQFWWLVVAAVAVACLFLIARTVQLTKNASPVGISATIAIVLLSGVIWWAAKVNGLGRPATAMAAGVSAEWEPFSANRFKQLRDEGKPVLVKFTANWCATCQVIEGTVFTDPAVWNSIAKHHVVALKVDLTDPKAPGKELLLTLNPAGGIPLTAVFGPGSAHPALLGSLYTSETLLSLLDRMTPDSQVAVK